MSRTSRLEKATSRIQTPDDGAIGQLGLNSADVPGGVGSVHLDGPVEVGGMEWRPEDGHSWAATIGAALALEMAAQA